MKEISKEVIEKFWKNVEKGKGKDSCWNWVGNKSRTIQVNRETIKSYIMSWNIHNGPRPDNERIYKKCKNELCVRPDHLTLDGIPHYLQYNMDFFNNKKSDYYYFLGTAVTDGCVSHNKGVFTLVSKDAEWLDTIQLLTGGKVSRLKKNRNELKMYSGEICNILVADNCVPRKTKILQLPDMPDKYFFDFLRGCIDGDGCLIYHIGKKKNKTNGNIYITHRPMMYLCSASLKFLKAVQNKIEDKLGFTGYIIKDGVVGKPLVICGVPTTMTTQCYRLCFQWRQVYNLLVALDYVSDKISMPRKQIIAEKIVSHYESNNFAKPRYEYNRSKENYYTHSNEQFAKAVSVSCNEKEVLIALGLKVRIEMKAIVAKRMEELNLAFTNFPATAHENS